MACWCKVRLVTLSRDGVRGEGEKDAKADRSDGGAHDPRDLGSSFAAERFGADAYDDSQSNPLRIAAYLIHPIGYTLEWLVTRPFHEVVAQPDLEPVFGHESHAYYGESPIGSATGDISVRRTGE